MLIPARLASVQSQASTSANSPFIASLSSSRSAVASSPTSSVNHMNVPPIPRAESRSKYICSIVPLKFANLHEAVLSLTGVHTLNNCPILLPSSAAAVSSVAARRSIAMTPIALAMKSPSVGSAWTW